MKNKSYDICGEDWKRQGIYTLRRFNACARLYSGCTSDIFQERRKMMLHKVTYDYKTQINSKLETLNA